jgi:hypothetical protein
MSDYDDFDDRRIKHMEMIQAVISRLGNDSFLIKGWAVTVAAAFLGFAVTQDKWQLALASIGPTLLFWFLDSTYLRNERLFRDLFNRVRKDDKVELFFMSATGKPYMKRVTEEAKKKGSENAASLWQTFWRQALSLFYGTVILAALLATAIICRT